MSKRYCKHSQQQRIQENDLWYAKCLSCGTQTELYKSGRQASHALREIKGPERTNIPITKGQTYGKHKFRSWTCGMYPETKVALQKLSRDLELNGVISRALVSLMSVPNEILIDIIKEHSTLYEAMWELSRSRDKREEYLTRDK